MRQQRIGVNGVGIFAVASKQEQRFTVQTRRQVFTAKLDDIVAFARLWLVLQAAAPG
jgi:hypothetical protein